MRDFYIFILFLASFGTAYSQSQRMVLIEENTNASNAASATQNPAFNALLDDNTANVVQISYHTQYPVNDPIYEDNPIDNNNRITYNSAVYIPVAILDGQLIDNSYPGFNAGLNGAPQGFSQATLDYAAGIPASFDIALDYSISPDGVAISATATCSQAVTGNLKCHLVVIEKQIVFPVAPGTNGETTFRNVMKKMLPDASGAVMDNSYLPGNTFTTSANWDFQNVYDPNQIAVVAYIQNDDTHEVLQAAYSDSQNFGPINAVDARPLSVSDLPESTCTGEISPSVTIRNNGSDPLTSVSIDYDINGTTGSQEWTGSLNFYQTETVPLGDISFTEGSSNILEVTLSNPNGGTDEEPGNNVLDTAVNFAGITTLHSTLEVYTDNYPGETSWSIRNSNNVPVATYEYNGTADGGGPDANTMHTHALVLDPFECFTFTLYDDGGDGMTASPASPGPFGYRIINGFGDVIVDKVVSNFPFGYQTSQLFRTENTVNVSEEDVSSSLLLYPNPSHNILNLSLESAETSAVRIEIFNSIGQLIFQSDLGVLPKGKNDKSIDISALGSGFYLVCVTTNRTKTFRKISVVK